MPWEAPPVWISDIKAALSAPDDAKHIPARRDRCKKCWWWASAVTSRALLPHWRQAGTAYLQWIRPAEMAGNTTASKTAFTTAIIPAPTKLSRPPFTPFNSAAVNSRCCTSMSVLFMAEGDPTRIIA
jgi:hypothetical protein